MDKVFIRLRFKQEKTVKARLSKRIVINKDKVPRFLEAVTILNELGFEIDGEIKTWQSDNNATKEEDL